MAEANALTDKQREYREVYLRSDHWRETRAAALERAGHRCQVCNSAKQLDVHHRTYERVGREEPGDLTVLCRGCHDLFHSTSTVKRTKKAKATPFSEGTRNEIADKIVIALTARGPLTSHQLSQHLGCPRQQVSAVATRLRAQGVVQRAKAKGKRWSLVGFTNTQPRPRAPMPGVRQVSDADRERFDKMREDELARRRADKQARAERRAEVQQRRVRAAKTRDWRDEQQLPRKEVG